ncbi:hypothetical protein JCM10213_004269 [Rhodosporidiobolus nylandii]
MTALVDPPSSSFFTAFPHRPMMAPSPSSSHFPPAPTAASPYDQHTSSSAAVEEDDLLALLGSDTFSLESARDKDLSRLQNFLMGVMPTAPGTSAAHHPAPPHNSGISISSGGAGFGGMAQQPAFSGTWNGWRPAGGEGAAAPYGSPMSFASSSAAAPVAPSSSFTTSAPHPSPAQGAFLPLAASPAAAHSPQLYGSPRRGSLSSRGRAPPGVGYAGTRAPACSRDRVPTLATFGGGAAQQEQDEGGWKSRLRSAGRVVEERTGDEDAMME